MHRVFDDVIGHLVGFAMDLTALDPGTSHPHRETPRVVVSTVVGLGQLPLAVNGPPELSAPNNERVFKHPALFQILNQAVAALIHILALRGKVARKVAVLVPTAVENLHKSHTALDETPRHDRGVRESTTLLAVLTVELIGFLGLAG